MTVKEVMDWMEEWAPLAYAEEFDNTGLLVGDKRSEVTGILVTLDTLESVVDEAIKEKCNLIVSFHPILFKGLKKLTGSTYVERVVQKAIRHDIAIYAVHTALDNAWNGVNAVICNKLQLTERRILIPQEGTIKKLVTYVPHKAADLLRNKIFEVGAGNIGNYDHCSFNIEGIGTFRGNEDSNPIIGQKGETRQEAEIQIGITFAKHLEAKVLKALFESHPYEEVAFEITTLENSNQHIGMGMIGTLSEALSEKDFLQQLKETFSTGVIRHSQFTGKKIKKVAVLGGSGSFALGAAKALGADAFVTSDVKYHDFFATEDQILLTDIGHYESEQYTKELIVAYLSKKISNFAPALSAGKVVLSKLNTNPISYY